MSGDEEIDFGGYPPRERTSRAYDASGKRSDALGRIVVVLPKQTEIGPALGVRVFCDGAEVRSLTDVVLDYSVADLVSARLVVLVSEVIVGEIEKRDET